MEVNWGRAFLPPGNKRPEVSFRHWCLHPRMCAGREMRQCSEGKRPHLLPTLFLLSQNTMNFPLVFPSREFARWKVNNLLWKGRTSLVCHCLLPQSLSGYRLPGKETQPATGHRKPDQKVWLFPTSYFLPPSGKQYLDLPSYTRWLPDHWK